MQDAPKSSGYSSASKCHPQCSYTGYYSRMRSGATPITLTFDFITLPRWSFHFWYHSQLQAEVVVPVSTRATTSTPAMETVTKNKSDVLPNPGATTGPIWSFWHPLPPSGTHLAPIWHHLAPSRALSSTIWHSLWYHLASSFQPSAYKEQFCPAE